MPTQLNPIFWFSDDPIPGLVDDPAIIVGGTSLLDEFLGFVASQHGTASLAIAVPYVGRSFMDQSPGRWEMMDHTKIDMRLLVRRRTDADIAADQLQRYPWRSLQVGVGGRLHAKLYAFTTARLTGALLVGSHNLSRQGSAMNLEAGVLMLSRRPGALRAIGDLHENICTRLRYSTLILDTTANDFLLSKAGS